MINDRSLPTLPTDLENSPFYLLSVIAAARKSGDLALESMARFRLSELGVRIYFESTELESRIPEGGAK